MEKKLRFVKPIEGEGVMEDKIQKEFEGNLENFEPGLKYVDSSVQIAIGTIDTLAIDEDKNPVIIEYKRPGVSAKDALIQALDYYVWCREGSNFKWLENYVKKVNPSFFSEDEGLAREVRIIVVADGFDERLKRAVSGVEPNCKLVSYALFEKGENEIGLLPDTEIDTSITPRRKELLPPKKEEDHFEGREGLKPLFTKLVEEAKKRIPEINVNPKPQNYIAFVCDYGNLCSISVKKSWLRIHLGLTADEAKEAGSQRYVLAKGWNDWGYIHLENERQISEVVNLIEKTHRKYLS